LQTVKNIEELPKTEWEIFFEKQRETDKSKSYIPLQSPFRTGQAERTQRLHKAQQRQKALGSRKLTEYFGESQNPTPQFFIEKEDYLINNSTESGSQNEVCSYSILMKI
jgi:hypothetical protein